MIAPNLFLQEIFKLSEVQRKTYRDLDREKTAVCLMLLKNLEDAGAPESTTFVALMRLYS